MANTNPRRPKRRKSSGLSRHSRGGKQKRSSYDLNEAKQSIGLPAKATFQQVNSHTIRSAPNPSLPRSPPKKVVKARLAEEQAKNDSLSHEIEEVKKHASHKEQQIKTLKEQVHDLSTALQVEKKKSRSTIAKLLEDAERIMSEACDVEDVASKKMSYAEMQVLDEKERAKQQVFEAEMKVSLEKQRSKLNMQEERRKNAAYLASGQFCIYNPTHHYII